MFDLLDPTPEQRRQMDVLALHRELTELRQLPRATLDTLSTKLTIAATMLAGKDPNESACLLHTARVLHVLAHETLEPAAPTDEPFPRAVTPLDAESQSQVDAGTLCPHCKQDAERSPSSDGFYLCEACKTAWWPRPRGTR